MAEGGLDQVLDWLRNRFFGKYRGIVTSNEDETHCGRLKVRVPSVWGETMEVWAMPCLPYAGNNVGTYAIPEPKAGVWVEFEGGDTSFPVWTGGYWADNELPKNHEGNRVKPDTRIIRSEKGLMITFNDSTETLALSDTDGKNMLTIEVQQGGKLKLLANSKITVQAKQIELVEDSTHPLVFGDSLLSFLTSFVNMFNAHIHPAASGSGPVTVSPPLVSVMSPQQSMLSNKVTTG